MKVGIVGMIMALVTTMAAVPVQAGSSEWVYVGMHGTEVRAGRFDTKTGGLTMIGPVASVPRPTWSVKHPRLPILYVANEDGNDGTKNGSVYAFRIDPKSGALTKIGEADAGGAGTTHLALDSRSMTLVASNYGGGSVATIPILRDGNLGKAVSVVAASGSGPHRRQAKPHAHSAQVDPSGHYVVVADLGADRLFVYPFDGKKRTLDADAAGRARDYVAAPGSGPRHFAFHPNGRFLYLVTELTADIQTLGWDAAAGRFSLLQSQSTNEKPDTPQSSASEILVSRDGRFVYAGNRGENSLLVYAVDPSTGHLSLVQRIGSGGETPWSFSLDPSGRWLLVANEKSDRLSTFAVDRASGRLRDTGHAATSPKPVSISFTR
jgi:6-phosphogluconolactonase (cycloisomerase 2 family)